MMFFMHKIKKAKKLHNENKAAEVETSNLMFIDDGEKTCHCGDVKKNNNNVKKGRKETNIHRAKS